MSEKHEPTRDPADPHAADSRAAKPDDAADRDPVGFDLVLPDAAAGDNEPPADQVTLSDDSADAPSAADPDTIALAPAARDADTVSLTSDALTKEEAKPADEKPAFIMPPASEGFSVPDEPVMTHGPGDGAAEASAARLARLDKRAAADDAAEDEVPSKSSTPTLSGTVPPTVVGGMSTTDWLAARPSDADEGDAAPLAEGTGNDADFLIPDPAVTARLSAEVPADERRPTEEPADEPRETFQPTTPTLVGVTAPAMPTVARDDAVIPPPLPPSPAVTDKPVQMDVEPSPEALASVPVERDETIPLAAIATGTLIATAVSPATAHDPTDAEVYAHAHEDVEYRAGQSGWGVVTKVAGAIGLAGCTAGLLIMLAACAGLAPATPGSLDAISKHLLYIAGTMVVFAAAHVALAAMVQKAWIPGAIVSAVVAGVLGAGAVALWFGKANMVGFNPLPLSWVIALAGGAGLVLAVIGGLIEHRRMREETHVLAAVFANFLAGVGGLLLYAVAQGWNFLESGAKAAQ